ncbi:MAG: CBS domain-containing protein [Candidatus Promineifilaceae bacterium]
MKHLLVKDWMTTAVISVTPTEPMLAAHKLMREKNIRRLPVVANNKVVGILTRSDMRQAQPSSATTLNVWEMNYLLARLEVQDVMSKKVITLHPDDTIRTAATLMHQNRFGALPVVDDQDHLVGIITESDIFRSNSQFNQKCVMLRACAELAEASSEASPSCGGAGCFPVRRCSGPKTPLSMTVQRKLQRNYLVRTNA